MHRRTGVFVLVVLALFGGLATGSNIFYSLFYLLILLLVVSYAWSWANINWLHISRQTRTRRTQVGRPFEERFALRNNGWLPKLWLELRDFSTLPHHRASHVVAGLGSRDSVTWKTTTICRQRGRYRLGPMVLSSSDPFGLFPMERRIEATTKIVVVPHTFDVSRFNLPAGVLSGGDALRRRAHQVTTNAAGVREYAPGDSYSRIHWPSTARRNRLIVKEFELDPLADIWILVDMAAYVHLLSPEQVNRNLNEKNPDGAILDLLDQSLKLPESTEEYAVAIAASLARYFARKDRAVGLIAHGQSREVIQPDRGERQLNRILETLAVIKAEGHVPLHSVAHAESQLFSRGSTLVAITPSTDRSWLAAARNLTRQGLRPLTILIDPASFGDSRSSLPLRDMLAAAGISAQVIRCDDDLSVALSAGTTARRFNPLN